MTQVLPPEIDVQIRARRYAESESSLARCDAAVFILGAEQPEKQLAALPHAELWRALYRAGNRTDDARVLTARLPNARHTLVSVAIAPAESSAFSRLSLAARITREVLQPGVGLLRVHARGMETAIARQWQEALASAVLASAAPMPQRKSKPEPGSSLRRLEISGPGSFPAARLLAIAQGNHLARWLATLPPNELDCTAYRRALKTLAKREGWQYRFYDEAELRRLGAGAFLAVTRANAHRGAGIVRLTYRPAEPKRMARLALVGKGICFDTGGINLKPHKSMYRMHGDMQGSAVAAGTLLTLSRCDAPYRIDCWLALTENEIGPGAYRPQEVVRACNGVTIQVVHSDAEGRMVLADTLAIASREKPTFLLDFATLTGTCIAALTDRYSGAFTNRPELHETLQAAGRDSGERVWCFPMDEDFDQDLESPIADVLQCNLEGSGDHILAARFLRRFVEAGVPWAHIDLAASERKGGLADVPTDMTGFGVRFASQLLAGGELIEKLRKRS